MSIIGYCIFFKADDRHSTEEQYPCMWFNLSDARREYARLSMKYFECSIREVSSSGDWTYRTLNR